jgi:hypothetical protein
MKYLYIQENKDWNSDNKFKYGYTENPKNRLTSEQHSHKSSYIALYECYETDDYENFYDYKEYDKIISSLRSKSELDIINIEIKHNIDLSSFKKIKEYLIYYDGGGTEFIYSNKGIELLDYIFTNVFKDIGINTKKLSKDEINSINSINNDNYKIEKEIEIEKKKKNNEIEIRDYQAQIIIYGTNEFILNKNNKFYLELATGAGKSTIIYYILNKLIKINKDNYYTIIIFSPRINISSQNINDKYINIFKTSFNIYNKNQIKSLKTFDNNSYNIISCCIDILRISSIFLYNFFNFFI